MWPRPGIAKSAGRPAVVCTRRVRRSTSIRPRQYEARAKAWDQVRVRLGPGPGSRAWIRPRACTRSRPGPGSRAWTWARYDEAFRATRASAPRWMWAVAGAASGCGRSLRHLLDVIEACAAYGTYSARGHCQALLARVGE